MKRKLLSVLMAGLMVFSLSSCGSSKGTPSEDVAYSIDVILKTTSSEYWSYVMAGANAYMRDNPDVAVSVKGASSETAYEEQQIMIETDMKSGMFDGFVIAPLQAEIVGNLIEGSDAPIVAVDTDIDSPKVISFVGTANEEAAMAGGEAAVKAAAAAGWDEIKAVCISGVQGDGTVTDRLNGYKAGIDKAGGEFLESEIQYADAVADKAVTCMENIMQAHPEGIAIICANNDEMAIAASRASRNNPAYAKTVFVGFDGIQSACNAIVAGEETISVSQEAYQMGYMAVDTVVKALKGEKVEEFIDSGSQVIDSSNAIERLDTLRGYIGS